MASNRDNQGSWRSGGRGDRGQFHSGGNRGGRGGRGQFSNDDQGRGRGGGRGGRGQFSSEDRGQGQGRGYSQYPSDGSLGPGSSRNQFSSEDYGRGRGGGKGYHQYSSDGSRGAGGSCDQFSSENRGRGRGRGGYNQYPTDGSRGDRDSRGCGRGEGRGHGRGRGGRGFEPVEVSLNLPAYAALKSQVKYYPIEDSQLKIPTHTKIKSNSKYFQKEIQNVEVNYVRISFTNPEKMRIFHYDVQINPNLPKYLLRNVMEQAVRRICGDQNLRHPGFDGERNLYTAGTELFVGKEFRTGANPIIIHNQNNGKDIEFDVTITLVDPNLNMKNILNYMKRGSSLDRPPELQCLEIALKGKLSMRLLPVGKRAFYPPAVPGVSFTHLSAGMELRHGLFQGAVIGRHAYLNIDVAHKGFPIAQSMLQYLEAMLGELPAQLRKDQVDGLRNYLKGLKIQYRDPKGRIRSYKNFTFVDNADNTTFNQNGCNISVFQYFRDTYEYIIQYRAWPLLNVGKADHPVTIPLELCHIAENQTVMKAYSPSETDLMVRECSDKPEGRKEKVMDNILHAAYNRDQVLSEEFEIQIGNQLERIDAMLLKSPIINYGNGNAEPRDGVWLPKNFNRPKKLTNWVILNKEDNDRVEEVLCSFVNKIQDAGRRLNFEVSGPRHTRHSYSPTKEGIKEDFSYLKKNYPDVQLIWVILPSRSTAQVYGRVKCVSELNMGILTQCVKWFTVNKMYNMPHTSSTTASNLLLKVNAKLGGLNYILADLVDDDTMFVGADVTHPGIGSTNPSIATVVGSYDKTAFNYTMTYSVQESRCENIVRMEDLMGQLLSFYYQRSNKYPSKIYYYRDGISDGQFKEMKETELMAIKTAGAKLKIKNFRVAFVVAQKRHHTRFFPTTETRGRNGNVVAGTVINQDITHPTEHDFFLVSHQSIQGTARPTKYHVIHNEIGISDDQLESMTYHLCYLFARCTRSVKYPTPTYYAHLSGKRAEHYIRETVNEGQSVVDLLANGRNLMVGNPMHFI